ncbi:hypothetical protein GOBAR_DD12139 [Gossypium barbadense]|nr:hypothetical protein GOBAR_DD12139 [Gossypium barbadense]
MVLSGGKPTQRSTLTAWATTNILIVHMCRTGRACSTAAGGIQTVQTHRRIRPLRSSDNIHRPLNPDNSPVNPHLTVIVRDRLDAAKLPKHPIAVIPLDDVEIYNWCVSTPYVGINECGRGYNICNF